MTSEDELAGGAAQAFLLMRTVENVLRELVIEQLNAVFGSRWHKTQVPNDVRQKLYDSVRIERNDGWVGLVPHHPIYYTDFPDLRKLIERQDNWRSAFQPVFGPRHDIITGVLAELEPIRNSIAHNRALSQTSTDVLYAMASRLRSVLGSRRFDTLVERSTVARDLYTRLRELKVEGEAAADQMAECQPGIVLATWDEVGRQWWFDDAYLGTELAAVLAFFELAEQYRSLPRSMGDGYAIERWLLERKFEEIMASYRTAWAFLDAPGQRR